MNAILKLFNFLKEKKRADYPPPVKLILDEPVSEDEINAIFRKGFTNENIFIIRTLVNNSKYEQLQNILNKIPDWHNSQDIAQLLEIAIVKSSLPLLKMIFNGANDDDEVCTQMFVYYNSIYESFDFFKYIIDKCGCYNCEIREKMARWYLSNKINNNKDINSDQFLNYLFKDNEYSFPLDTFETFVVNAVYNKQLELFNYFINKDYDINYMTTKYQLDGYPRIFEYALMGTNIEEKQNWLKMIFDLGANEQYVQALKKAIIWGYISVDVNIIKNDVLNIINQYLKN